MSEIQEVKTFYGRFLITLSNINLCDLSLRQETGHSFFPAMLRPFRQKYIFQIFNLFYFFLKNFLIKKEFILKS